MTTSNRQTRLDRSTATAARIKRAQEVVHTGTVGAGCYFFIDYYRLVVVDIYYM